MIIAILEWTFALTILLCLSTYAFYPLIVMLIGKWFAFSPQVSEVEPKVSVLIAAYNEEKDIARKLENTLDLDYPQDKLEILVGSDGSSDRTAEIVAGYADRGVRLLDCKENRGKTAVQNDLFGASSHDILVFTDAASFLRQDSLSHLVQPFADSRIGAVAGYMQFVTDEHNLTTSSQGLYWRYEVKLREIESSVGRLIGVDGPLYAVRRDNYIPLESHIISDLMTPLLVLKQNKKVVLKKEAIVYEVPTEKSGQELNTRRRITLRGLIGLFSEASLLSPLRSPLLSLQIFFHKMLRWGVGLLVLLNLLACIGLAGRPFFAVFLMLHMLFYLAAMMGWLAALLGRPISILRVPYYFCLVNLAATLGILDFLKKKQAVAWKPVR